MELFLDANIFKFMRPALLLLLLASVAHADIIEDVRAATGHQNFAAADSQLQSFRSQHGVTPEYLEALSWMARGELTVNQLEAAQKYARQTQTLTQQQLKTRKLDSDPHLPIALGAAYEVQAQVLDKQGQRAQAVALLQAALRSYGSSSIRARLQKNLNLLSLVGRPAPELKEEQNLGPQFKSLADAKGSPVLLFFWAHWCGDCKYEAPIITKLRSEYSSKGLRVVAPTKFYGYAGQGEDASPVVELAWIDKVRQHFYSGMLDVPVPISKANFDAYGASTTPTLVLLDRKGDVDLYHPGLMSYEDLKTEVDKVLAR
jgi:thiol-disulfide isomerase/thioredoxin